MKTKNIKKVLLILIAGVAMLSSILITKNFIKDVKQLYSHEGKSQGTSYFFNVIQ